MTRSDTRRKVIVIGLDGATFDIIDPMLERGELPVLRRFIDDGARGVLRSVVPPYSPPAWMSMLTGKNPGKHGVFHFLKRREGSYELDVTSFRDVRARTLFALLEAEGIPSGAMNIPMTFPPPARVSGFFVSGIPVPPGSRAYAAPARLVPMLEERGYRVDYDFRGFEPNREQTSERWDEYRALFDGLIQIARKRVEILLELMETHDFPLFFHVISLTDRMQHYFWRFRDPGHPGYDEEGHRRFGDALEKTYRETDQHVGRIVEAAGPEANVLIVSDHGFGGHYGDFHLNAWLREKGYLRTKPVPRRQWKRAPVRDVLGRLGLGFLSALLPGSVRRRPVPYPGWKRHTDLSDVIWAETRAFASMYGIRVNLKGREPEGVVEPGRGYRDIIESLKRDLAGLKNPLDGRDLLTGCMTKEEAFSGAFLDGSPDLFLNLADISVLPTERWDCAELCEPRRTCPSSGTHRIEGVFLGKGPAIRRGIDAGDLRIEDILPTILHILDVPLPRDLDGGVIARAMEEDRPIRYREDEPEDPGEAGPSKGYTEEEEDQITENLRGMGYI
jgi:predicted AlkP superfamily phosphohydrolase/phosphomutase